MKSRSKKLRLSRWLRKQSGQKEVFKAPIFEQLEERQLMSGALPASASDTLRFAMIGDFGSNNVPEADVAAMVASKSPEIVVTAGDNRYGNLSYQQAVGDHYGQYVSTTSGGTSQRNRFFPAPGNHEYSDGGGIQQYLSYFDLPGNNVATTGTSGDERYYDVIEGPVHFFFIDSGTTNGAHRATQKAWLETTMSASTSPWQVVLLHHAPYSSSAHGSNTSMQWDYAAWGADAVMAGHEHSYERLNRNGIPYFVNGLGGAYPYNFNAPVAGSQFRYNDDYGAMIVDATSTGMEFQFVARSGAVIDTYTLGDPDVSGPGVVDAQVSQSSDDAEESISDGSTYLTSSDIELGDDLGYRGDQVEGLRFQNLNIPQGAAITSAYLSFTAKDNNSAAASFSIHAADTDNASTFTSAAFNITGRSTTSNTVSWSPGSWSNDQSYQSPNISSLVQEVVGRGGWNSGNSMAFVIEGTGQRNTRSFNGSPTKAARLHVEYTVGNGTNHAPVARANNVSRTGAGNVTLNGSASSDPDGDNITYRWTNSSGTQIGTSANLTQNIGVGSHQFTLTVRDPAGLTGSKTITATATSSGTGGVNIISNFSGNNAGGWSLGAGASNVVNSGGLRSRGHHSGNVPGESNNQLLSSKTRVRNENIYIGRTVAAGNDLRGAELKFTIQRHDWNSPRRFFVTANGQEVYNSAAYTGSGQHAFTANLGQQSVLSGSGPIDLRIYAYEGFWYGHSTITAFSLQGGTTGTNHAPTAVANNVSRTGAGSVTLNGSGSSDPDGDNLSYLWTNASGTTVGTTANVNTNITVGSHAFTLRVTDPGGLFSTKTITATATSSGTGGVNIVSDFSGNNAGGWSLGSGASNVVNSGGLRSRGHHSGNVPGESNNQLFSSKTRVRNESIYVGRTIAAGNDLRGADLEFTIQRYDWNSPRRFFVTANGTEVYNSSSYTGSGQQSFTATLGQQSALSGSSSIDLRIYAYEGLWYGHSTLKAFSLQGGSTTGGTTPVNVTSNFSGSNAGGWTAGAGFSTPATTDGLGFTASNYSSQQVGSTFVHARANNHYIKRTISSSGTMDLRGAQLQLTMQRTKWNSPHSFVVEIHGAGIGSNGIRLTTATIGNEYGHKSFTLTLPQNSQLLTAGDLEFRVYAYDGLWGGSNSTAIMRAFSLNSV